MLRRFLRHGPPARRYRAQPRRRPRLCIETLEDRRLLAADILYRVNAGGPLLNDTAVVQPYHWSSDTLAQPASLHNSTAAQSKTASTVAAINTGHSSLSEPVPPQLFQTERWDPPTGSEMQWQFPVPAGDYEVRLYFAETYGGTMKIGGRVFDVVIEGQTVLDDFDVFAEVGANTGIMKSFVVTSDSLLNVDFHHVVENPAIKGIEIRKAELANQLSSSHRELRFDATTVGDSRTLNVQLRNTGKPGDAAIQIDPTTIVVSGPAAAAFDVDLPAPIDVPPGQSVTVAIRFQPTDPGTAAATLQIPHSGTNSPLSVSLHGSSRPDESMFEAVYRVNAGGPGLTGLIAWEADNGQYHQASAAASQTYSTTAGINLGHASIPPDTPLQLFQSERWDSAAGAEMQWDFPVAPGPYEVRLYFAELYSGAFAKGARLFDVSIEQQLVLDNLDVYAEVGAHAGLVKTFLVSSDGNLDIDFGHQLENPAVKAIEIRRVLPAKTLQASTSDVAFGSVLIGRPLSRTIQLTNPAVAGSDDITVDPKLAKLLGDAAGQFNVTFSQTAPIVLKPGQSTPVAIRVTTDQLQSYQAQLSIEHSGSNSPLTLQLSAIGVDDLPIGFGKSKLQNASLAQPTSLQFGPDGRLYVSQQNGLIQVFQVARTSANSYQVTSQETIDLIQKIPNHNDDGSLNSNVNERLVTGILVAGTASEPILYVSSSDPRIGGGDSGDDKNIDTNSSMISRLTRQGGQWKKQDLVVGLPRSVENHAANGMQLDASGTTLYVAQGGNTNMGAPSNNFAYLPEYALSAAVLSIDLQMIGDTTYILPTLDDEDRPGSQDAHDPFGGNDGKNQARLVPGGPVQVYASGFRNPYDVVLTTSGRLYSIDNGPNAGWGGTPHNEGPGGTATNQGKNGGLTYGDGLHLIPQAGYYAGHPNPTRSNPANTWNSTNPQSPVSVPNPIESDYQIPGVDNQALVVFTHSTNGLAEYTASNFQGLLQGDLLAASFDNSVKRIKLNASGDQVVLNQNLFSSVGVVPLDVIAVGDQGPYPGTIWVTDIVTGSIVVFEPGDYLSQAVPAPQDPNDLDGDGFSNADEEANGTNPNSAGDVPPDRDGDFVSDLSDDDDDNDGLLDNSDAFAIDAANGSSTFIGVHHSFENDGNNTSGLLNLGFTGLMTNGQQDYQSLYDIAQLTAGGAAGVLTLDHLRAGTAAGSENAQHQAFQFGVHVAGASDAYTARTRVLAPFSAVLPEGQTAMGLFVGSGDQDNFVQLVVTANDGQPGVSVAQELNGLPGGAAFVAQPMVGVEGVDLMLTIDPALQTVQASYALVVNGQVEPSVDVGAPFSLPASWLQGTLAVGILGHAPPPAAAIAASWDFLELVYVDDGLPTNQPPQLVLPSDLTVTEGQVRQWEIVATDPDGDDVTWTTTDLPSFVSSQVIAPGRLRLVAQPDTDDAGDYIFQVRATDNGSEPLFSEEQLRLVVQPAASPEQRVVLYRVNAGGPQLGNQLPWMADPSSFHNAAASQSSTYSTATNIKVGHPSIPAGTPAALFQSERWDPPTGDAMTWSFPVEPGTFEVRLYFAEIYAGAQLVGGRQFDVQVEQQLVLDNYDAFAKVGANAGIMESFVVQADGSLDITLLHVKQNPAIKGIEILGPADALPPLPPVEALFQVITPGNFNEASTSSNQGPFKITNKARGGQKIVSVTFDASTAFLPDQVFDPFSIAGDVTGQGFHIAAGQTLTGFQQHQFQKPHDDGFDALHLQFTGFDPGETLTFGIDMDPTSIRGASQQSGSHAGSVSGLDLVGSQVTVHFDTGEVLVGELFRQGTSLTNSETVLVPTPPVRPTLSIPALGPLPVATSSAEQLVRVSGPAGARVSLMQFEGSLELTGVPNGGFDLDPFEANFGISVAQQETVIGPAGVVGIPITLTSAGPDAGLNHFVAVLHGAGNITGPVAKGLVKYTPGQPNQPPTLTAPASVVVKEQDLSQLTIQANDPNNDSITLTALGLPGFASFDVQPDGTAQLRLNPQLGDAGNYTVRLRATDDGQPPLSSERLLTIQINGLNDPVHQVVLRVNAGGPPLPDTVPWQGDLGSVYLHNAAAAQSKVFSTSVPITLNHPSVPPGTPMGLFQSERWDDLGGSEMQWDIPLPAGRYLVRLYFAETYGGAQQVGGRVFDVSIEGQLVLDNLDVFAEVGANAGLVKSLMITSDGQLDIDFQRVVQNPAIKAIEILTA